MEILEKIKKYLNSDIYDRDDKNEVCLAFERLGVEVSTCVKEFYKNFAGPFWEESMGMELLDIIDDDVNIETMTLECRKTHGFPNKYLVLTELVANEILVLDSSNDKIYRVDFEGGDTQLLNGKLFAEWESFEEFLICYFGI